MRIGGEKFRQNPYTQGAPAPLLFKPAKRLKILFIGESPVRMSGLGNCSRHLVAYRLSKFHDVDIAGWLDDGSGYCKHRITKYAYQRKGSKEECRDEITRILNNERYDIVITAGDPFYFDYMPEIKYKHGVKWLFWVTIDGDPLGKYYYNRIMWHADSVVSFSEYGRKIINNENPCARIGVIPPGFDPKYYHPIDYNDRVKYRRKNKNIRDRIMFLFAGQNTSRKQLPIFLNYAARFRDFAPPEIAERLMFTVISDMKDPMALNDAKKICARLGFGEEMHWIDCSPDNPIHDKAVASWMHLADFYVSTAIGEGYNVFLLQARACGLPAIVPAHTSMLEQVSPVSQITLNENVVRSHVAVGDCGYGIINNTAMPGELDFNRFIVNGTALMNAMNMGVTDILGNGRAQWFQFSENCVATTQNQTWDHIAMPFLRELDRLGATEGKFLETVLM